MMNVFLKIMVGVTFISLTSACGTELDKSYEKEKDKREKVEIYSEQVQEDRSILESMIKNAVATDNYIWAWTFNGKTTKMSVSEASAFCEGVGYALPTSDMLPEAQADSFIGQELFSEGGPMFKVLDLASESEGLTLCAKKRGG